MSRQGREPGDGLGASDDDQNVAVSDLLVPTQGREDPVTASDRGDRDAETATDVELDKGPADERLGRLDLDDLQYPRSWEHGWDPGEAAATAGDAKPTTTAKSTAAVKGKKSAATKAKAGTKTTRSGSASRGKAADTWS